MKTTLSFSTPAELETESLVAITLDHAEKDHNADSTKTDSAKKEKPQLKLATGDAAVQSVAADLLASGELTGKPFEINLAAQACRTQGQAPVADRRRHGEEVHQLRSAPPCWSRRAYA
jgi:hypothetical protein